MSNAAIALQSSTAGKAAGASTGAVLENHLRAARTGVDAVMQDYTEESVLITHEATYRGLAAIRGFFTALFRDLPAGFFETLKMNRQEIIGEVAYILWERQPQISRATDTFVVRNGKILAQTFTV
jgi:ketosteroid isomerase-like protein